MDIKKYEAFLCAVDTGSFTAAAEKMHFTPAGISHMADSVEESLGLVLLNRGKHGVTLTHSGELCIDRIRQIVRAEQQLQEHAAEILGLVKGKVTVGAYYSVASHWLPPVFRRFLDDYPDVEIELKEGGHQLLESRIAASEVDFCIYTEDRSSGLEWYPLCDDELLIAVPSSHPFADLKEVSLDMCKKEQWIMPASGQDYDVLEALGPELSDFHIRFTTIENYSALAMVEQGLGISMMNRLITTGLDIGVRYLPLKPRKFIHFGIAVPSMKSASPAARMLISYIREMLFR